MAKVGVSKRIETISREAFLKIISERYSAPIEQGTIIPCQDNRREIATSFVDQRILYWTAKSIRPKTILEIGTKYGYVTLGLFINAFHADVYTIDIYREMGLYPHSYQKGNVLYKHKVGKAFKDKIPGIHQVFGDSRDIKTYSFLKGRKIDFAFIDGNHSFDAAIKDTRNVLKFSKTKTIIFWHDFMDEQKVRVKSALNALAHTDNLKISYIDKTLLAFTIL